MLTRFHSTFQEGIVTDKDLFYVRETIRWNVEAAFLNVRTPLENQEPVDRINRQFTMMISCNLTACTRGPRVDDGRRMINRFAHDDSGRLTCAMVEQRGL